jgi:hypothetical protein
MGQLLPISGLGYKALRSGGGFVNSIMWVPKELLMSPERITSLSRPNTKNALPLKKKLSTDYRSDKGKRTVVPPIPREYLRVPVEERPIKAFALWRRAGDSRPLAILVLSADAGSERRKLVLWFKGLSGLTWNQRARRFSGKRRKDVPTVDVARAALRSSGVRMSLDVRESVWRRRLPAPRTKCAVCGFPAMPGEATCYDHKSD